MQNRFGIAVGSFRSAEQAAAARAVCFAFWMAAIGREFVVFSLFNVLFDAAAVLETESIIICVGRLALLTML
jgi:hypothetical protein